MKEMTIRARLVLLSSALVAITMALAGLTTVRLREVAQDAEKLKVDSIPGLVWGARVAIVAKDGRALMLQHMSTPDARDKTELEAAVEQARQKTLAAINEYEKSSFAAEDRQAIAKLRTTYEELMGIWPELRSLSVANRNDEARALYRGSMLPRAQRFISEADQLIDYNQRAAMDAVASTAVAVASTGAWTLGLSVTGLLFGAGLATWIVRGTGRVLGRAVETLRNASAQVASATQQLAASSTSLASGSSEQAASLEETSASTEEIHTLTRQNAENAKSAATFTAEVAEKVRSSNLMLDDMLTSMRAITDSSDKISRIMKVIEEIAFQTNILALNAAVEAARAGDAGMGFAVVADEVRNLAQRCAHAAKDTSGLIEDARTASSEGRTKLEHLAAAIRSITTSAERVKELADQVHVGSQEQSRGVEQISTALSQMDQTTQRAAATSEETAAAAQELTHQAHSLQSVVASLSSLAGLHDTTTSAR